MQSEVKLWLPSHLHTAGQSPLEVGVIVGLLVSESNMSGDGGFQSYMTSWQVVLIEYTVLWRFSNLNQVFFGA